VAYIVIQVSCMFIRQELFLNESVVGKYVQLLSYADKSVFRILIKKSVTERFEEKGSSDVYKSIQKGNCAV
jgi:hypothetical protein